jgi:hypothetical protein
MDDAYTGFDPDIMKRAKQIARNTIDELGPRDLASVVFISRARRASRPIDRSSFARSTRTPKSREHEPPAVCQPIHRSCDVDTLSIVASTLLSAPPGRKIVILVSGGRTSLAYRRSGGRNEATDLIELFRDLSANVTFYVRCARAPAVWLDERRTQRRQLHPIAATV